MKALAMAGNMLIGFAISEGIRLIATGLDKMHTSAEEANENIQNLTDEFESSAKEVESLTSELEDINKQIDEIQSKGKITLSDKEDLGTLTKQRIEAEKTLAAEKAKEKIKAKNAVSAIDKNSDKQFKNLNKSLKKYTDKQTLNAEDEEFYQELVDTGFSTDHNEESKNNKEALDEIRKEVSDNIKTLEKERDTMLKAYGGDIDAIMQSDQADLYKTYQENIASAYKTILDDNEYTQVVIKPVFETVEAEQDIEDLRGKLSEYFADGGSIDTSALEARFGKDVIDALRQACIEAGIQFPDMIQEIFNNASQTEYSFAPQVKAPNGANDAKQNNNSKDKIKVYHGLNSQTRDIVDNATVPDNVKNGTEQDFKNWIAKLQKEAHIPITVEVDDDTLADIGVNFTSAWEDLANSTDDSTKDLQKNLLDLASAGKLTEKAFEQTDTSGYFKNLGISAEEAIEKINRLVNEADQLSSMKSGISSLSNILTKKQSGETIGADTLAGIPEEVKSMTSEYENFTNVLGNNSSTMEECQKATDDLATAYVNSNNFLSKLNETNKQSYIDMLSEMGVKNAEEVVTNKLADAEYNLALEKEYVTRTGKDLSNATAEEINQLASESANAEDTRSRLAALALATITCNGTVLDTSGDITNLMQLCEWCGIAKEEILEVQRAKANLTKAETSGSSKGSGYYTSLQEEAKGKEQNTKNKIKDAIRDKTSTKTDVKIGNTGNTGKSGGGSGGSKAKESKTVIDWIERKISRLNTQIDLLNSKLQNIFDIGKKETNLDKQITKTSKLITAETKAVDKYDKKANSVVISKDKKKDANLKKAVREGRIKGSLKTLIATYGEKTAEKIQKYQDYYDKARTAENNKEQTITKKRQLQEQKYQLRVDEAENNRDKLSSQRSNETSYAKVNGYLQDEVKWIQQSYEYQIKIARLTKDETKEAQLRAELEKALNQNAKEQFDAIAKDFEYRRQMIDEGVSDIDRKISQIEANGANVNYTYYQDQKANAESTKASYKEGLDLLQKQLPYIEEGTEEWYAARQEIENYKQGISDSIVKVSQLNDKIRELAKNRFDNILSGYKDFIDEISTISGFDDYAKSFDKDLGSFSVAGITDLGSLNMQLEAYKQGLSEIKELRNQAFSPVSFQEDGVTKYQVGKFIFNGEKELYDFQKEISKTELEWSTSVKEMSNSIYEKMKEYYQGLIDLAQELVNKKTESLQKEKELYEYQKKIKEQSQSIAQLQMRLAAVRGDSSQEGMARQQQLQADLKSAQDTLRDTEYDQSISDQTEALNNMMTEYQETVEKHMEDFQGLLSEGFDMVNKNTTVIADNLVKLAGQYDYDLNPLNYTQDALDKLKSEGGILNSVTTALESIKGDVTKLSGLAEKPQNNTPATEAPQPTSEPEVTVNIESEDITPSNGNPTLTWGVAHLVDTFTDKNNSKVVALTEEKDKKKKTTTKKTAKKTTTKKKKAKGNARGGLFTREDAELYPSPIPGEDGIAGFKIGERVLTKVQGEQWEKLSNSPLITNPNILTGLENIAKIPDVSKVTNNTQGNVNTGDIAFTFNLDNVTDTQTFLNEIKNNKSVQNAIQTVVLNPMVGKSVNNVKHVK